MNAIPQFTISAPTSGAGKTTLSRGLMALLTGRGLRVQPFKCGPDYIDTKFHEAVCGRPSVNIDTFFCSDKQARKLYATYAAKADAAVVEGMMGMYDGYDRDRGATADISRALGLPILMVVDARSAAYSLAPLLSGFKHFRDDVDVMGVVFNRVGSKRHAAMLRQVCHDVGLECFGFLPRMNDGVMESRYLGLDFSQQSDTNELVKTIAERIDWQRIMQRAMKTTPIAPTETTAARGDKRIGVARNAEAFSFIYQHHIDLLRLQGEVVFFDPEADEPIPHDTDLLYLPGGYPEKHAAALSNAVRARRSIAAFAARGGKIVAECGGMMYLCKSIMTDEGESEMCGVLPYSITARTADRHLSLGYRQFILDGKEMKGHEFHYSQFVGDTPTSAVQVFNAVGERVPTPVFRQDGVLASYTHLYWNEEQKGGIL